MSKSGVSLSATRNIILLVSTIISYVLLPVLVDAVEDVNTTGWTFTGHEGAEVILGLSPFVWVCGITVATVLALLGRI